MVDRKIVPFDEFYYQLKLMYLFLLHVVCIVVFYDIRAVSMTVCWHHLLFQFSNFVCPDLVIYFHAANSNYYLSFPTKLSKYVV
jgi:hypothetical protein